MSELDELLNAHRPPKRCKVCGFADVERVNVLLREYVSRRKVGADVPGWPTVGRAMSTGLGLQVDYQTLKRHAQECLGDE